MWFKPLQEIVGDIVNYEDTSNASSESDDENKNYVAGDHDDEISDYYCEGV